MAELDDDPATLSANGEDVKMDGTEVKKPDMVGDVSGVAIHGGWHPNEFGLIGHDGNCEVCSRMRTHLAEAMANGEAKKIMDAIRDMLDKSNTRLQLPVMSIDDWAGSLSPVIDCPPDALPLTPTSWLTYLANNLPAEIALLQIAWRPCNRLPNTTESQIHHAERMHQNRLKLLRDVLAAITKLQAMVVSRLYAPISDDTPQAILNELPRRMRGLGDSRHPRRPIYPVFRTISTFLGDIICAVPSRTISPFEVIESDYSLLLPGGPNGHAHIPGSLWNNVARIPVTEAELRAGTWSIRFLKDTELLRLFVEAIVIPWLARSLQQRAFVRFIMAWIIKQAGEEALSTICNAVGVIDLDEQGHYWSRANSDVPDFIGRQVVGNAWHWDEIALQAWALVEFVFPHKPEKAMTALRSPRDPYIVTRAVPDYNPYPFMKTPQDYSYSAVRDHLVYECGIDPGDLKYLHEAARDCKDLTRQSRNGQESLKWNHLRTSKATATIAQLELTFDAADPPLSAVEAHQVLAGQDRRHIEPARRIPAQPSHQSRQQAGPLSSPAPTTRSSSSHDRAEPATSSAVDRPRQPPPAPVPARRYKRVRTDDDDGAHAN
ncbi:hypothetical protein AURDEDRAFT_170004 [Auricularia subglabra TFB-10046 SS5]|uniref:Uncharacterized protein n=1 Tax=Auricularia subglabra (strain TFB-10046 / SS5) TaxID=717982 RepID=J0WX60_AURST|nr:hypothetical protein AURDEDRAFT_170004 [Auricularia subglabra TFB-10046 SS5]